MREFGESQGDCQRGLNSDLSVRGQSFHVQTEDWGPGNPFVVSRVFCNGAVLRTYKTPYSEIIGTSPVMENPPRSAPISSADLDRIKKAIRNQHHNIMEQIFSGSLDFGRL